MIKRVFKKGLLPAIFVSVVLAAAFFAPSRVTQLHEVLTSAANCYAYPSCAIYTTDAYGPLHEDQVSPVINNYPVFSSTLVRAAHYAPGGAGVTPPYTGLVLDAFGGFHPYNRSCSAVLTPSQYPYFPNMDIARDFVWLSSGTGGYELDGFGGIHPFSVNGAALPPAAGQYPYFTGQDVAKKITLLSTGLGGYVLDAFGGIHPWSVGSNPLPAAPSQFGYWNFNIARDIWVDPAATPGSASGYVLDGWGGFHPWWTAAAGAPVAITQAPYYPGNDIARILWFEPNATPASVTGYELDGYGGVHPFADAADPLPPAFADYPYWAGRDIAKAFWGFITTPPSC